jgi:hypothetical protein
LFSSNLVVHNRNDTEGCEQKKRNKNIFRKYMAAEKLICNTLINFGPDGRLYDYDFNQTLGLTLHGCNSEHIKGFDISSLSKRFITTGLHC